MRQEETGELAGGRLVSPSAGRNKGFIANILKRVLPETGVMLEVSSGTGEHAVHFARTMPYLIWQPTECDAACLQSIRAWLAAEALGNVNAPLYLDVHDKVWPIANASAAVCINMIHIAPASAAAALFRGAAAILDPGAALVLYGPFQRQYRHTSPSNEAFDRALRTQNPEWGVRNLEDCAQTAGREGFALEEVCQMPANNLTAIFRRL
jgi:Protein of unknown function (DUF938)